MALAFSVMLAQAACVGTVERSPARQGAVRVTNNGQPFRMWEGAAARKAADAVCGGRVNVSIYDRYDPATGAWVYPGGCA